MNIAGAEGTLLFGIIFWGLAALSVTSALLVIQLRDVFKAALALVVTFLAVAGLLVMLNAEFIAVVQVLIYAGAIPILIIFAIMLVKDVEKGSLFNNLRVPAFLLSAFVASAIIFVVVNTGWELLEKAELPLEKAQEITGVLSNTVPVIGELLVNQYALAFEAASVVLLAAIIGAIVIMRER